MNKPHEGAAVTGELATAGAVNPGESVLVAYHANCTDGFTAAWVVSHYFAYKNVKVDLLPVSYDNYEIIGLNISGYDRLFIVDFSVPPEDLEAYKVEYPNLQIVMLDHHRTAMAKFTGKPDQSSFQKTTRCGMHINIYQDFSGAALTWIYLFPKVQLPWLIRYVQDYDLWRFIYKDTKAINKLLRITDQTIENWTELYKQMEFSPGLKNLIEVGRGIQKYHDALVDNAVKHHEPIELAGFSGLVTNCPPDLASDVGHHLACMSGTFGATWHQENGNVKFSLRSNGNYDVSALAQKFGGGGHKNAAGFILSNPRAGEIFPDEDNNVGISLWHVG